MPGSMHDESTATRTHERRIGSLRHLDHELTLSGVSAYLVPDGPSPYLRVELSGTHGENVRVSVRDGQRCYLWAGGDAAHHSLADPAGAARRILIALGERRDRAGR